MTPGPAEGELLVGCKQIARFLGLTPRQASWHIETGTIPVIKLGRTVSARKVTLLKWLEDQESQSTQNKKARGR